MTFKGICDPESDEVIQWAVVGETTHWEALLDTTRYPDIPSLSSYISAYDGDENDVDEIGMGTILGLKEATKVRIRVYAKSDVIVDGTINLYVNGWQTPLTMTLESTADWYYYDFNGSWSQSDIDGMEVRFSASSAIGKTEYTYIYNFYCEVTYTTAVPIAVEASPDKPLLFEGSPDKQLLTSRY